MKYMLEYKTKIRYMCPCMSSPSPTVTPRQPSSCASPSAITAGSVSAPSPISQVVLLTQSTLSRPLSKASPLPLPPLRFPSNFRSPPPSLTATSPPFSAPSSVSASLASLIDPIPLSVRLPSPSSPHAFSFPNPNSPPCVCSHQKPSSTLKSKTRTHLHANRSISLLLPL